LDDLLFSPTYFKLYTDEIDETIFFETGVTIIDLALLGC